MPRPTLRSPLRPAAGPLAALIALTCLACTTGEPLELLPPGAGAPVFGYPEPELSYPRGVEVAPQAPLAAAGFEAFEVEPPLPAGLVIDLRDGTLRGAPTELAPPTQHTVRAFGPTGTAEAELIVEVVPPFAAVRHLHTLGFEAGRLAHLRRDGVTSVLHAQGEAAGAPAPRRAEHHPSRRFFFTLHYGAQLALWASDPASGAATPVQVVSVGGAAVDLAVHPSGRFLFATSLAAGSVSRFAIDPTDGSLSALGAIPSGLVSSLVFSADGQRLHAALLELGLVVSAAVDPTSGELLGLLAAAPAAAPFVLALHPGGAWLAAAGLAGGTVEVFEIDGSGGPLALHSVAAGPGTVFSLAFDPGGSALRAGSYDQRRLTSYAFDAAAGALQQVQSLALPGRPGRLRHLEAGELLVPLFDRFEVARYRAEQGVALSARPPLAAPAGPIDVGLMRGAVGARLKPQVAYTANAGTGDLDAVSLALLGQLLVQEGSGSAAGTLVTAAQPLDAGPAPRALAVNGSGSRLFSASQLLAELRVFRLGEDGLALPGSSAAATSPLPQALAANAGGTRLFAAGVGGLESFAVNADGTAVTRIAGLSAGLSPAAVALHPSGRFVWVASRGSGTLHGFRVTAQGQLETLPGGPLSLGDTTEPRALALTPDGRTLAVALSAFNLVRFFAVDPVSGALSPAGEVISSPDPRALAASPDGRWLASADYALNRVSLYRRNPAGTFEAFGHVPVGLGPNALAFDPGGNLLLVSAFVDAALEAYAFTSSSGELTLLDRLPLGLATQPVAVAAVGRWEDL